MTSPSVLAPAAPCVHHQYPWSPEVLGAIAAVTHPLRQYGVQPALAWVKAGWRDPEEVAAWCSVGVRSARAARALAEHDIAPAEIELANHHTGAYVGSLYTNGILSLRRVLEIVGKIDEPRIRLH